MLYEFPKSHGAVWNKKMATRDTIYEVDGILTKHRRSECVKGTTQYLTGLGYVETICNQKYSDIHFECGSAPW